MSYPHLFKPGAIGDVEIRNRVVLPSMTTRLAEPSGEVTTDLINYYQERARGGCGLVTVEMASPQRHGRHRARELGIDDDEYLPGLTNLTAAIKAHGARAAIQLGHGGARALPVGRGGNPRGVTPGPMPVFEAGRHTNFPELLDDEGLDQVIVDHVAAAQRAEAAGFDVIELHGAHGYLLAQITSADENHVLSNASERYAYIGALVRRVVDAVTVPICYRFSGEEYYGDGQSLHDSLDLLDYLDQAGVSAVSVTGGHYKSLDPEIMIPPMSYADGLFLNAAQAVKAHTRLPVVAVGRLNVPQVAEDALAAGAADFIAIGRGQIADPHWVRKSESSQEVRTCLACNFCVRTMRAGGQLACAVNPTITTNDRPQVTDLERRLVLGAGPAGLTYAIESSRAGHQVHVVAKDRKWRAANAPAFNGYPPDRERMNRYYEGLWQEAVDAGVTFSASTEEPPEAWRRAVDTVADARGASYRAGLGVLFQLLIRVLRVVPLPKWLRKSNRLHDLLLYQLRKPQAAPPYMVPGAKTVRVGDAAAPGELAAAVADAHLQAWKETRDDQ
jgi:2,4-dienoyl-CoA reductase-like NADH-dependent reductase (Old Yellow Enzyme family)